MLCPLCQFDNPADAQRCRACGAALGARPSASDATWPDALPNGTVLIGTYAVEGVLGQGGFGITYRCHDRMLDRRVAVKEFFPSGCRRQDDEVQPSRGVSADNYRDARAQFLAEARVLARCHHRGIVGVYTAFEANSTAYMVMELLHGKSLAQLLSARGGRMEQAEAVSIVERVGEALGFVHDLELLHRDIKPDNIIVCDDGRVMLIDFGTAREYIKGQVQGQTVVVTPGYAPLEQYAKQAQRGAFTDVYSLAATLYHLLTGQMPPTASDRAMGVLLRPVREENPRISAGVARAVEAGLRMEIAKRPQSVREFLDLMHAPAEETETVTFAPQRAFAEDERGIVALAPQFADAEDESDDWDDSDPNSLPPTLSPDAVRARQQLWQGMIQANPQPVQLAPHRAYPPGTTPSAPPVYQGSASGNAGINNANRSDSSMASLWWLIATLVGFFGFVTLVSPKKNERFAHQSSSSSSSPSKSYTPPRSTSVDNTAQKRDAASQAWNALPLLLPTSVETLPVSDAPKGADSKAKSQNWGNGVKFSPDGKRLAYVDRQSVLHVLSLPSRRPVRSLKLDKNQVAIDTVFSTDNQTIAVHQHSIKASSAQASNIYQIAVWSLRDGKRLGTFTSDPAAGYLRCLAVLSNGQLLLRTLLDGPAQAELFLWNPQTGERGSAPIPDFANLKNGKRGSAPISSYADLGQGVISPDGNEFVVGDSRGHLQWLNARTGAQGAEHSTTLTEADYKSRFGVSYSISSADTPLGVRGIDYSLNGSYLASRNDAEINVFDLAAKKIASLTIDGKSSLYFSMSPDGKLLAARGSLPYSPLGNLLWNVRTGQKIRLQAPSENLLDWGFSQDGKQLYGIFGKDEQFQFVTWQTDAKPAARFAFSQENSLPFSETDAGAFAPLAQSGELTAIPDGETIAVRTENGVRLRTFDIGVSDAATLEFSPESQFLAVRQQNNAIRLWDVDTGKSVLQMVARSSADADKERAPSYQEHPRDLAFSPDADLFACARPDGDSQVVQLWSLKDKPRRLASFVQQEPVSALSFSPDGKGLICAGQKGLVQWYDVAMRRAKDQIETGEPVFDIAFAARNLVVMGNSTTTLYQVPASSPRPLRQASPAKLPDVFNAGRDAYTRSAISADGKLLVTAQGNTSLQVWQLPAGLKVQSLMGQNPNRAFTTRSLNFSDDGTKIIAVGPRLGERQVKVTTYSRAEAK